MAGGRITRGGAKDFSKATSFKINGEVIKRAVAKLKKKRTVAEKRLPNHKIEIGFRKGKKIDYYGEEQDIEIAAVAAIHEISRPWMRPWFDDNKRRIRKEMRAAAKLQLDGVKGAVKDVAFSWIEELKEALKNGDLGLEDITDETKLRRVRAGLNASPPLYATGQMAGALRAVVKK